MLLRCLGVPGRPHLLQSPPLSSSPFCSILPTTSASLIHLVSMSSTNPSALDNHRFDKRYNVGPTPFPVIMSKSVHRKTSISKRDKLKQLDALAFSGASYNSSRAISFSPSSQSASQVDPDLFRKTKSDDLDDASLYSEASAEGAGGHCPTMDLGAPFSPLSMLFEGILADSQLRQGVNDVCQDDSPYPYSPASADHSRVASQQQCPGAAVDRKANVQSKSDFPSPSTLSSTSLATPDLSPDDFSGDSLDQALAELKAQKALSESRPRHGFEIAALGPEDSLLLGSCFASPTASRPPRKRPILTEVSEKQTGDGIEEGNCSYNLTMPGGGPLLEPPGGSDSSLSPFWYSPPVSTQLIAPPTLKKEIQLNVIPPPRPPRPEHCSITLADFGDASSAVCSPYASASPSLKALRKTPAAYLHPHSRSSGGSSICIVDKVKTRQLGDFKLAPAPSKGNRLVPDDRKHVDRSSTASVLSFVSAKSNLSTTKIPEYPATDKLSGGDAEERLPALVAPKGDPKLQSKARPLARDRLCPPSASRAPLPESIDLPAPEEIPLEIVRKPSLVSKLSLSLRRGKETKATLMGATDYSKQSSSGLSPYDTTVTPFPLSSSNSSSVSPRRGPSLPSSSPRKPSINLVHTTNPNPNLNRFRSTSLTTNHTVIQSRPSTASSPCPPSTTLTRTGSRLRSYSSASKLDPNTWHLRPFTPLLHSASSSPPPTNHKRTPSTTSHYNNTTQQHSLLPRKSSLKRKPSISSSSLSSSSSHTTRAHIVDSATSLVMSSRKVTFGEVQEINSQQHEISSGQSQFKYEYEQEREEEEARQVEELQSTASFKGFGFGTFYHLGLSWGRRA
ncbi:uncharacterized protein UTRI_02338 [Ustilago trichophora]|uniref:Uncharacterized protein n=1 Tax=Ustilago trichophora TaxID=86804 RepID=A0A5C3E5R6_9BASI|nr:uncharacterized protein UTRI_02338 [Ustilago trichophora]